MSIALDLLENTDKKMIDIAFDCRMNVPESFSRKFKSLYGISPRNFRKSPTAVERFNKIDVVRREFLNRKNEYY